MTDGSVQIPFSHSRSTREHMAARPSWGHHLCFVVPHTDTAVVEAGQHPGLRGVQVHTLDAVRARRQLPLDVQSERLGTVGNAR